MSITERHIDRLRTIVVRHPAFKEAEDSVLEYIQLALNDEIVMCLGPTGSGKSTVLRECRHSTASSGGAVHQEAPAPKGRPFAWRIIYMDALEKLGEIGATEKVVPATDPMRAEKQRRGIGYRQASVDDLGEIVNQEMNLRRPPVWIIDECQHIGASPDGRVKAGNLDVIKSHRNQIDTPIVLAGTYQADDMLRHTDQMSRRIRKIHLRPYTDTVADKQIFLKIVERVLEKTELPIRWSPQSIKDDLHMYSAGCVGILVTWLCRAAKTAQSKGQSVVPLQDLWGARRSDEELEPIFFAINQYKAQTQRNRALGWRLTPSNKPTSNDSRAKTSSNRKTRIGVPGPRKRPIGPDAETKA